jgi:hypothetical protein
MRLIVQHLRNVASTLREYAAQAGLANHGDNIGGAREGVASFFLSQNLPASVDFVTGEVFDSNDERSGQIDLIIYPKTSPRLNLHGVINLVLSDSVIAAIEVKSTLTTASLGVSCHLWSALDSCVAVKRLKRLHPIKGNSELKTTPFLIFAFDGPTQETLEAKIHDYRLHHQLPIDLMPDMITVLSKDYYLVQNNGWHFSKVENSRVFYSSNSQPEATLTGMYAYLTKLIEAMGQWPRPTPFSQYLRDLENK